MSKYLTKIGLTKYTTKLKEYISKAKVASAASADNATKVNNHTVNIDVPANAKFTDTDTWRPQPDWNATSGDAAIKNKPTSMPASDVPSWAKQKTKPTYTASEIGLGNVGNFKAVSTVGSQGLTDTEKTNARVNIGAQVAGSYANASHTHGNGDITSLDASKITSGTIDIDRLPQGALDRLIKVADDTARFKLTTKDVQLGDSVKVTSTKKMYIVVDETKLSSEAGYEPYTADSATSVPWSGVTGKPSTYTPSSHTHTKSQITDFPTSMPASDVYAWAKASTKPTYSKSEVGLGKVDNTADADKSVKHAATAGSANSVAWSNVSGKPALGNAASKTTRGLNATAASGWKDATTDGAYVPDMTFIAYWNGAYSNTASNLAYCNKGAFGTAATANKEDFAVANHTHSYNNLTNKPTIPSVGNGTVTITQNGATKGSFTMNQGGNTTIALTDTITSGRVTAGAKAGSTIGQYATAEGSNTTASGKVSHAEGNYSSALGQYSHAEGLSGTASGEASHSEGNATEATGFCSHAEGNYTLASGQMSHASGCGTQATRFCSYSEGLTGKATGVGSHVEGTYAVGYMGQGDDCYTEVDVTIKEIPTSQLSTVRTTTGLPNVKYYMYYTNESSSLNCLPDAVQESIDNGGNVVHLFDNPLSVDEFYQFTPSQIKQVTIPSVINKPALYFGNPSFTDERILKSLLNKNLKKIWIAASFNRTYTYSLASGAASHCEGGGNTASGHYSHAEGVCTTASGLRSHAQGSDTTASGTTAFASGCSTIASGQTSYAGGSNTAASGAFSFSTGLSSIASGYCSFAEGDTTIAEGAYSHASGFSTKASNTSSYAMGHFNAGMTTGGTSNNKVGTAFLIGNGTNNSVRSNAFSVQFSGITKAANTITASTTADYAEFFEWLDENPNAEDRVGYFVTLDGNKIKIAEADDDYILGVISGAPFVLGNGDCDVWNGMYLRDEFRRLKEEPAPKMIRVKNKETKKYENQVVEGEYEGTRFVLNPNYDSSQKYKSRFDRPEWAAVGMLGVLPVRHDGTAQVNGYVTVGANGIATTCEKTAENAYRVIKENSDSVVEIIFR
jgi:hypothetical protein